MICGQQTKNIVTSFVQSQNMPLFGRGGPKNPQELVKCLNESLSLLEQHEAGAKKAEKVRKRFLVARDLTRFEFPGLL